MKKLALLLSALLLLPLAALAELNYQVKSANQICFPDFNQMTAYFQNAADWIFVTPENLEEHFDMVLARGGTEEQIRERDHRDMTRPIAPLKQADDAVLVDTCDMTIDEVVDKILSIIDEKIGG